MIFRSSFTTRNDYFILNELSIWLVWWEDFWFFHLHFSFVCTLCYTVLYKEREYIRDITKSTNSIFLEREMQEKQLDLRPKIWPLQSLKREYRGIHCYHWTKNQLLFKPLSTKVCIHLWLLSFPYNFFKKLSSLISLPPSDCK